MSQAKALKLLAENRARELSDNAPAIRTELGRISASAGFRTSQRSRLFLEYVVEKAIVGRFDELKERVIGSSLFGRPADYDTGADSIVRVVAIETRRRLQAYYAKPETDASVRIELSAGSYLPSVHYRSPAPNDQHENAAYHLPVPHQSAPPSMSVRLGRWMWLAGTLLLAALAMFLFVQNQGLRRQVGNRKSTNVAGVTEPWSALFTGNRGLNILLADTSMGGIQALLRTQLPLADYVNRRYIPDKNRIPHELSTFLDFLLSSHYTSAAHATAAVRIAQLAQSHSVPVSVSFARDMSLRTFKSGENFVVLGSTRANPWAQLFDSQLNFSLEFSTESDEPRLRNRAPRPGEPSIYVAGAGSSASVRETYGQIAFLPNFYKGGHILFLTGTDSASAEAAGDLVTNSERMRDALIKLGADPFGNPRSFEILLRVRQTLGTPIQSEVISGRLPSVSQGASAISSFAPALP